MPHLTIFSISTFPIYPYVIDNWLPSVLQLLSTLKTALLEDTLYLVKMLALSFPKVCIVEFVPHHGWQLARPPLSTAAMSTACTYWYVKILG